jgi:hypothetical protein
MQIEKTQASSVATQEQLRRRGQVQGMQLACASSDTAVPTDSFTLVHHFAPGTYARELHMPAGFVMVGKIHRHAHFNILSKGCVHVFTEHDGLQIYTAPHAFVSEPGTQRVFYVQEDSVWTTVHATNCTDLAELERELIAEDYTEFNL